jgi:antibiotic biosynthesis monooxygenase (ABM) superfamily enzyme
MHRRSWMTMALLWIGGALTARSGLTPAEGRSSDMIVLYCDLVVKSEREREMLEVLHHTFRPAAEKFEGYIDLKILKYDHRVQGAPLPADINYRFQLTYESLALQQAWVNSPTHKKLWPLIAATLSNPDDFQVLVFRNA